MPKISEKNNFLYLFISLSALLFSGAIADDLPHGIGENIFSLITVFMIIIGVKSLHTDMNLRRITYLLAFILGGLNIFWSLYPTKWTALMILLLLLFSFMSAFKLSVKKILFEGVVDRNKIIGSISLYLLLGLIWTIIYLIIILFEPNAFNGIETQEWRTIFSRIAYYSFVTLTTLGYGDISPANHISEFFVYMEAIAGVFYMAIFVSSLINLHNKQFEKEK